MPRPLHDHTLPSPIPAQPACRRLPTRAAGHGRARALTAVWRQLRGRLALALALGFASVSAAWAGPFSYLQGLGVDITNGMGAIDRPAAAWTPSAAGVSFQIEDSVGAGGLVGPGIGGQPFDLEALYVQRTATQLIITGVSGAPIALNPAAGTSSTMCFPPACDPSFGMGDFFIGVRVGGAFAPRVGVELTGHAFMSNSLGYTSGWTSPLRAGGIVDVSGVATSPLTIGQVGWESGLSNLLGVGAPSQISDDYTVGFSLARLATLAYETIGEHTAYQAIVKLSDLGSLNGLGELVVHWGEACGNDFLRVDLAGGAVPAPPTLSLLGLAALLGLAGRLRNRAR
jgi:hypothetical protein